MALALLCFLIGASTHRRWLEWTSMAVLVVDMIAPAIFKPFARVWFGLATALSAVTSRIVLLVLFFVVVVPVGVVRRAMGKDPMQIRRWRRDRDTVFARRDHLYESGDLEHPY
jgi:hypothetical protein